MPFYYEAFKHTEKNIENNIVNTRVSTIQLLQSYFTHICSFLKSSGYSEIYVALSHSIPFPLPTEVSAALNFVYRNDTMNCVTCLLYICIYRIVFMFLKLYINGIIV